MSKILQHSNRSSAQGRRVLTTSTLPECAQGATAGFQSIGGPVGCKCQHCFGLAEYLDQAGINSHGLPRAPGHGTLAKAKPQCQGTMTCICPKCQADRVERRPRTVRQPWQARAA